MNRNRNPLLLATAGIRGPARRTNHVYKRAVKQRGLWTWSTGIYTGPNNSSSTILTSGRPFQFWALLCYFHFKTNVRKIANNSLRHADTVFSLYVLTLLTDKHCALFENWFLEFVLSGWLSTATAEKASVRTQIHRRWDECSIIIDRWIVHDAVPRLIFNMYPLPHASEYCKQCNLKRIIYRRRSKKKCIVCSLMILQFCTITQLPQSNWLNEKKWIRFGKLIIRSFTKYITSNIFSRWRLRWGIDEYIKREAFEMRIILGSHLQSIWTLYNNGNNGALALNMLNEFQPWIIRFVKTFHGSSESGRLIKLNPIIVFFLYIHRMPYFKINQLGRPQL